MSRAGRPRNCNSHYEKNNARAKSLQSLCSSDGTTGFNWGGPGCLPPNDAGSSDGGPRSCAYWSRGSGGSS